MQNFTSIDDVGDPMSLAHRALAIKKQPFKNNRLGENRVLGMVFFNASLRTRMSTTRAAYNLGMKVITLNVTSDSWQLELEDGAVMDQGKAEHIKDAIPVMSSYCDVLAVRAFPTLKDKEKDYKEEVLSAFLKHSRCPLINLESATLHPLQSLADLATIESYKMVERPRVVLTWAPHVSPLPQSVANSFAQWMNHTDYDFTITHPKGLELSEQFVSGANVEFSQEKALQNADFVYVKNWSSYEDYGKVIAAPDWIMNKKKLERTNQAKLMHCLPVRRNVVIADDALDSDHSIIYEQAENRLCSAQAVLESLLKDQD
ncbi:MAG: acetylornithine carbamoyltransferase [Bacteroidota bacterium]